MKKMRKLAKLTKATTTLVNDLCKAFKKWHAKIKTLAIAGIVTFCTTACGVTKASINNKAAGTTTTITITTNNPITTTTDANPETNVLNK